MKKTYINPEIKEVIIKSSCSLLTDSQASVQGNYDSNSVTIASRKGGFFDDDEE